MSWAYITWGLEPMTTIMNVLAISKPATFALIKCIIYKTNSTMRCLKSAIILFHKPLVVGSEDITQALIHTSFKLDYQFRHFKWWSLEFPIHNFVLSWGVSWHFSITNISNNQLHTHSLRVLFVFQTLFKQFAYCIKTAKNMHTFTNSMLLCCKRRV